MNTLVRSRDEAILIDPSITNKNDLAKCFRIFTNPATRPKYPTQCHITPGTALRHQEIKVYTDGVSLNNGKWNTHCSSRVWFASDNPQNKAIRVPRRNQSNQVGELAMIIATILAVPPFCPLAITTNSKYSINGLTTYLQVWEDRGWIGTQNAQLFRAAAYRLRQ